MRAPNAVILLVLLAIPLVSGCTQGEAPAKGSEVPVADLCVQACTQALAEGRDLSNGPCLANRFGAYPDTVCDVAHNPRTEVDDNPNNQCSAFRQGLAKHFVEVTPNCVVIRER